MSKQTATPTVTRTRRTRTVAMNPVQPTDEVEQLMREFFTSNNEANAAANKAKKARLSLYAKMTELGLKTHETKAGETPIVALISTPTGQAVDPVLLSKKVDMNTFLKMVEVSQKSVTETVGSAILNQVLVPVKGTENVSVKVKK